MKITVARSAGYCYGVKRAVETAMSECAKSGLVYTLGPVIHNTRVCEMLAQNGAVTVERIEDIPRGSTVIIRAHGVGREVYAQLLANGCKIVDATCPTVSKIHRIAEKEEKEGRQLVILGRQNHPEVIGIAGWCKNSQVIETEEDLKEFLQFVSEKTANLPPSFVSQTTLSKDFFLKCKEIVKTSCTTARFFDTICKATAIRQDEARTLSRNADKMIIVGDPMSANTGRLVELCKTGCRDTFLVRGKKDVSGLNISSSERIGVTAGASTPDWVIKEVVEAMSEEIKNTAENGESFEELLSQSFKTLNTGDKVTGVVTSISGNEIYVDLGVKQAGILPVSELTDDPNFKPEEHLKVGDEIEASVVRVNDVEGMIMLSKKRLDTAKVWETIETAVSEKTIMEGTVVEENKGGIVVSVSGVRVFVPASQSGIPKDQPMSQLIKTRVKLIVTEVNRQKRRVVGSIRAVLTQERRAAADEVWEVIEPGKKYAGVVKSLTSYGAFVDIGGVDGMVHVSELSWNRVRHPSEILTVGQPVDVYVISVDKEKKKISLGYRLAENNPWLVFENQYKIGMVVPVKVIKFMPFGAFAEIIPGIDGLIHISQIADRRIGKPDEVLTVGETVEAKITDIDWENKKISLSIRALFEPEAASGEDEPELPESRTDEQESAGVAEQESAGMEE